MFYQYSPPPAACVLLLCPLRPLAVVDVKPGLPGQGGVGHGVPALGINTVFKIPRNPYNNFFLLIRMFPCSVLEREKGSDGTTGQRQSLALGKMSAKRVFVCIKIFKYQWSFSRKTCILKRLAAEPACSKRIN